MIAGPNKKMHYTTYPNPKPTELWHVTCRGKQIGPIEYSQLQDLYNRGELTRIDMAWTTGMHAWVPIGSIISKSPHRILKVEPMWRDHSYSEYPDLPLKAIRTNRSLIAILLGSFICLGFLGGILAGILPGRDEELGLAVLCIGAIGYVITIFVYTILMIYRMWSAIPINYNCGISPGKAIGFCFIPFFNIYWFFRVLPGWAKLWNSLTPQMSLPANFGILIMDPILTCCSLIPFLNIVALPLNLLIFRPLWIFHVSGLLNDADCPPLPR